MNRSIKTIYFPLLALLLLCVLPVYAQDEESTPVPVEPCGPIRATVGEKRAETQVAPPQPSHAADPKKPIISLEEAGQRFGEIQDDYFAEDVTKTQKRKAQLDLHDLLKVVEAEQVRLHEHGDDNVVLNELGRLHDAIGNAVEGIDSEMGSPPKATSKPSPIAKGQTIPSFDGDSRASQAADQLKLAQVNIREHWRNKPPDSDIQKMISWDGKNNNLLLEMMVAEERFAWDAAGSYSTEERDALADPYSAMRNMRNSLADMSAQNREIEQLLDDMATFEVQHEKMMQGISEGPHWSGGGRAGYIEIAFVRMAHGLIVDRINAMNLMMGAEQEKLLKELQQVNETLNSVNRSRRERGIRSIRQKACQQALVHRERTPDPFYVHRPEGSVRQRELANLLRRILAERLGKSAPQTLMGDANTILDSDKSFTRTFDSAEQKLMLGEGD